MTDKKTRGKYQRTFPVSKVSTASVISAYILHILNESSEPMYGKEIAHEIKERTARVDKLGKTLEEGYQVSRGILYGGLRILEEKGLVTGAWEQAGPRPTNKKTKYLYKITDAGRQHLEHFKIHEHDEIKQAVYVMTRIVDDLTG